MMMLAPSVVGDSDSLSILKERLAPGVKVILLDGGLVKFEGCYRDVPRCDHCTKDVFHPTEQERTCILTTTGQARCWKCRRHVRVKKRRTNYRSKVGMEERARIAQIDSRPRTGYGEIGFQ